MNVQRKTKNSWLKSLNWILLIVRISVPLYTPKSANPSNTTPDQCHACCTPIRWSAVPVAWCWWPRLTFNGHLQITRMQGTISSFQLEKLMEKRLSDFVFILFPFWAEKENGNNSPNLSLAWLVSLSKDFYIGPARASFVKNPTDGAHINLWQPLKNGRFYEAKVVLHFDL